jgi:hypothetical protein
MTDLDLRTRKKLRESRGFGGATAPKEGVWGRGRIVNSRGFSVAPLRGSGMTAAIRHLFSRRQRVSVGNNADGVRESRPVI